MSVTAARRGSLREAPGIVAEALTRLDRTTVLVGLMTLGALALRLTQIHQSLFGDEVWTYQDVVGHSLGSMIRGVHTGAENSPPLFFVFAWASAKLGDPTVLIRLPSLILGVATIPLIYLLGRQTVGRLPGLIGAAIVAAGPFSLFYGIEARTYSTMAFFVVLSTLVLVKAVRTSGRTWWLLYVLAAAAAAYTHYTSIFVLAVQAVWSLWVRRDRWREPLLANALLVLLYIPWLPNVRGKLLGVFALFEPLTPHNVAVDVTRLAVGYPFAPISAIPTHAGVAVVGGFALLGLATVGWRARGGRLREAASHLADSGWPRTGARPGGAPLITALALATPVGLLLYSMVGTEIWSSRSLYASLPAVALVLGALLYAIPRPVRIVGVVGVLTVLVLGTVRAISPRYARPPMRHAAQYLDRVAGPRDPIIMYPSFLDLLIAIPTQLHNAHVVLNEPFGRWPQNQIGARAYAVMDDSFTKGLGIPIPHPRGFKLVSRRHYSGGVTFTVLGYQRTR